MIVGKRMKNILITEVNFPTPDGSRNAKELLGYFIEMAKFHKMNPKVKEVPE